MLFHTKSNGILINQSIKLIMANVHRLWMGVERIFLKGLLRRKFIDRKIDYSAINHFFSQFFCNPRTLSAIPTKIAFPVKILGSVIEETYRKL